MINENIRRMRKERNISAKELAEMLGVSEQTIGNYERGDREPNISTMLKLCDVFCVTLDYLVNGISSNEKEISDMVYNIYNDPVDLIKFLTIYFNFELKNDDKDYIKIDNVNRFNALNIINSIKNTLEFELYKIKHNK